MTEHPKSLSKFLLVLFIVSIALLARFYNFENRINFGPEQASSLIVSGDYIQKGFSLLGQPYFNRTTSEGHILFSSAYFTYSLVPLQLLFHFDPKLITAFFTLVNIFSGGVIFFLVNKMFKFKTALLTMILFLFNDYMINHSLFIWNLNYMPLIGIISFYLLVKSHRQFDRSQPLILGFLSGLGFGMDYLYLLSAVLVLLILIVLSKNKLINLMLFILGGIIGNLPMLIFDLKHKFYYLNSLWVYSLDTRSNPQQSQLTYYHFLQFWPILAILGGILLSRISKKPIGILVTIIILGVYIIFNLTSPRVSFTKSIGMADGLTLAKLDQAAKIISFDNPENFNITSQVNFDTPRSYPLRYILEFRYGRKPSGVEDYPKSQTLYSLAPKYYNFRGDIPWEISSVNAGSIIELGRIDAGYSVFKLTKN